MIHFVVHDQKDTTGVVEGREGGIHVLSGHGSVVCSDLQLPGNRLFA